MRPTLRRSSAGTGTGAALAQPCLFTNCARAAASAALAHVAMAPSRPPGSPVVKTTVTSSLSMHARTSGQCGC